MIVLQIENKGTFMSKLLVQEVFDEMLLADAELRTSMVMHIDGTVQKEWYDTEERPTQDKVLWRDVKGLFYSQIKGQKTPLLLRLTMEAPEEWISTIVERTGNGYRREEVNHLSLNIKYEKGILYLVTAVSLRGFRMDHFLEQEWDSYLQSFCKHNGIEYRIEG